MVLSNVCCVFSRQCRNRLLRRRLPSVPLLWPPCCRISSRCTSRWTAGSCSNPGREGPGVCRAGWGIWSTALGLRPASQRPWHPWLSRGESQTRRWPSKFAGRARGCRSRCSDTCKEELGLVSQSNPFHSVDFLQSRIGVNMCLFKGQTINICSSCFWSVLRPPCLQWHNGECPCFSVVPEAIYETSRGPLKGTIAAQKALQRSKTETKGGTEEKSVSQARGHLSALQTKRGFFAKKKGNGKKMS